MYLHFVNPKDNSIMEVDAVLALIDKNSDYLDELYKEFNVLLSEVRLPLHSCCMPSLSLSLSLPSAVGRTRSLPRPIPSLLSPARS